MTYLKILAILCVAVFLGCQEEKERKNNKPLKVTDVKQSTVSENQKLIQGTWQNVADTLSTLVFTDSTTTNFYQGIDAGKQVKYTIGSNCLNINQRVSATADDRYISTGGTTGECYYIERLDNENLVMTFLGGDITLRFKRIE